MSIKQVYKNETSEDGVMMVQEIYHNDNLGTYDVHIASDGELFESQSHASYDDARQALAELSDQVVAEMGGA